MTEKNTFSIETDYKEHDMRSRLEARTAYLLDQLEIKWKYEQHQVMLSTGELYIPDFYLPEQDFWIECKGNLDDPTIEKAVQLAEDKKEEIMILSQQKARYLTIFGKEDEKKVGEGGSINLIECSVCGEYCFVPNTDHWGCRKCDFWPGDGDIVKYGIFGGQRWIDGLPPLTVDSAENIDLFIDALEEKTSNG